LKHHHIVVARIVVADDSSVFRSNLRRFVEHNSDLAIVGEAQDGVEALDLVEELSPDILLLDIEMPRMDGLQVLQHLQQALNNIPVIVLTGNANPHYRQAVLQRGAAAFLTKEEIPSQLISAIRTVMQNN
jgi:DNA-binding NarL/FixJ family response regulator